MNTEIESLINPELLIALTELSKQDTIIEKVLEKDSSTKEFVNALIAAIVCISDRELQNVEKINEILKTNPKVQEMLDAAKNDTPVLPESEDN
jgi:hypothetical protein